MLLLPTIGTQPTLQSGQPDMQSNVVLLCCLLTAYVMYVLQYVDTTAMYMRIDSKTTFCSAS